MVILRVSTEVLFSMMRLSKNYQNVKQDVLWTTLTEVYKNFNIKRNTIFSPPEQGYVRAVCTLLECILVFF